MTAAELAKLTGVFDRDELQLLHVRAENSTSQMAAARSLGWPIERLRRVRNRLHRKLDKLRSTAPAFSRTLVEDLPSFSYPSFRERLGNSGRRCWSMRVLPRTYIDAIVGGLPIVECPNKLNSNGHVFKPPYVGDLTMKIRDLEKQLGEAQQRLARLWDQQHSARVAMGTAESALSAAQREFKQDQVDSVLQEKTPDASLKNKLAALQTEFAARESDCDTIRRAIEVQAQKVNSLEHEVQARELESDRLAFAGPARKLDALYAQMADVAAEVRQVLQERGRAVNLDQVFFPLADPGRADWGTHEALTAYRGAFNAAFNLLNTREAGKLKLYDRAKEAA